MEKHLKEKLEFKAVVNKIIKFSSVDGPGNRCVIFFQGCNFNCKYCHNPETINKCIHCKKCIEECQNGAIEYRENKIVWNEEKCIECDNCIKVCPNNASPKTKTYTVALLLKEIEKVADFIDGITVSGGECSLNAGFIQRLFYEVKKRWSSLSCFLDTNGSLKLWKREYKSLLEVTDSVMLDIKNIDNEEHIELTGSSNTNVIKNFFYLKKINKLFEIRTVVYNKSVLNTVEKMSKKIENTDISYKIIRYRPFGVREVYKKDLEVIDEKSFNNFFQKYNIKKIIV